MHRRAQQGFTLIELMIVVAIVGILAAIAIPAYQDYIIRSKVSEAAAALGACKTSVSEYTQTNAKLPTTIAEAGCSTTATQYVNKIDVGAAGVITATIQNTNNGADPDTKTLILTPDGPPITKWTCTTGASKKYVPANCR
jgi:type IV pilus assembly protein PilA